MASFYVIPGLIGALEWGKEGSSKGAIARMEWGKEEEGAREAPQSPIEQPLGLVFPAYPSYPQSRWRQPDIASVTTDKGKARAGAQCVIPFLSLNLFTGGLWGRQS